MPTAALSAGEEHADTMLLQGVDYHKLVSVGSLKGGQQVLEVYWESITENITAKEVVLRFKVWAMSETSIVFGRSVSLHTVLSRGTGEPCVGKSAEQQQQQRL
ncbi:hypothetical protein Anapl_05810 [Anas platyrhynchos]|uniref:Uncharacterized protein n=1 Tax=Anas platyrhynchos TaxID=8839 RepID=R0LZG6_ANAPL|nr:hypothetical protein Anapl_05810 [Anas platyrhynchos]